MNKSRHVVIAAVLLALSACAPRTPDTAADEAALKADPKAWMDAFNAGDADAIAALYADDAMLMAPGTAAVVGPAAIRELIARDIASSKGGGLTFHDDSNTGVGVSGDTGWVSGTYSVTDASGAVVDKGKYLSISRRINGDWQMIRDTWNSDMAPPPAAAPAAETPATETPAP